MDLKKEYHLFSPSGCLSEEGLLLRKLGLLSGDDLNAVEKHLESCELCATAAEGYEQADSVLFSEDVGALNAGLETALSDIAEKTQEPELNEIQGIQGPQFPRMSPEEMRNFTRKIKESPIYPGSVQAEKVIEPEHKPGRISFWRGHRTELVAAGLLLLLAVGSWQIFIQLKKSENSGKLAVITENSDTLNEKTSRPKPEPVSNIASDLKPDKLTEIPVKTEQAKVIEDKETTILIPEDDIVISELDLDTNITPAFANEEIAEVSPPVAGSAVRSEKIDNTPAKEVKKSLSRSDTQAMAEAEEEISEYGIFTVVEESPQYPGGDELRLKFLSENIKYPQAAREASVQGTVYITFVVEADGTITNTRVLRGIGKGCDEEALRVIKLMPKWLPGKQRGKPVRVQFNLPIKFSLAG